mmetsp:Transcript_57092/g.84984  ORF Transcript_57092/g.84984 Transcript_57092/m.84984 type:complete len:293 (+) Transcript_57092:1462-2340(+)
MRWHIEKMNARSYARMHALTHKKMNNHPHFDWMECYCPFDSVRTYVCEQFGYIRSRHALVNSWRVHLFACIRKFYSVPMWTRFGCRVIHPLLHSNIVLVELAFLTSIVVPIVGSMTGMNIGMSRPHVVQIMNSCYRLVFVVNISLYKQGVFDIVHGPQISWLPSLIDTLVDRNISLGKNQVHCFYRIIIATHIRPLVEFCEGFPYICLASILSREWCVRGSFSGQKFRYCIGRNNLPVRFEQQRSNFHAFPTPFPVSVTFVILFYFAVLEENCWVIRPAVVIVTRGWLLYFF